MKITNLKKSIVLSILFTSNNILYTLTNFYGDVLFWTSTGSKKARGLKKTTSLIVISTTKIIITYANKLGYNYVHIKLKGFGKNKKIILKSLKQSFLQILSIRDESSFPHNGCKKPKIRRI